MHTLIDMLEDAVKQAPQNAAIVDQNKSITYKELDASSDLLAIKLLEKLGDKSRVAVLMNRSIEAVCTILGILKAGMTYVPISPNLPIDRIGLLKDIAKVDTWISDKNLKELVENLQKTRIIDEIIWYGEENRKHTEIPKEKYLSAKKTSKDDIAIIQFTSGSTGRPKVVPVTHENIGVFVEWWIEHFQWNEHQRIATSNPYHFGASFLDTYATILAKAKNYIIPQSELLFPASLVEWLSKNKINHWYTIPSVLTPLAERGNFAKVDISGLKNIMFAGEVFRLKHLQALMQKLPHVKFTNFYGSTEGREITYYPIKPIQDMPSAQIPTGYALPIVDLLLINSDGEIIKGKNQEGELCVCGKGVMHGYLESDNQSTFFEHQNKKYYKTGDIAKIGEDGAIFLVGRVDHQIKSRGYRVNLNEIENYLYQIEGISEAIVFPVPHDLYGNLLHAYIGSSKLKGSDDATVINKHKEKLPVYMVPTNISILKELPKTATGKIDRKKLQESL